MSDISKNVLFSVVRIKAEFTHKEFKDEKPITILGTGFWLEFNGKQVFVTNKHNVDPTLKLGVETPYELTQFKIELRQRNLSNQFLPTTQFFEVNNLQHCLIAHSTADCAILLQPQFKNLDSNFSSLCMRIGLAEGEKLFAESDFNSLLDLARQASFIGFPAGWHDSAWTLPIVRPLAIACHPNIPFTNTEIKTTDVHLVSGLSFKGSSGSPVIMHAKGIRVNAGDNISISGNPYTPCAILGIMSGHFWEDETKVPEMFNHSGLSYYTRSTSIHELLIKSKSS